MWEGRGCEASPIPIRPYCPMDELDAIIEKYKDRPLRERFESLEDINRFAIQFYRDVAEIPLTTINRST